MFGLVRPSVRPSVCLSVRLSVRLSHPEGGCLVDITSPSLDVPRGFFLFIFDTNKDYKCATLRFQFDRPKIVEITVI